MCRHKTCAAPQEMTDEEIDARLEVASIAAQASDHAALSVRPSLAEVRAAVIEWRLRGTLLAWHMRTTQISRHTAVWACVLFTRFRQRLHLAGACRGCTGLTCGPATRKKSFECR